MIPSTFELSGSAAAVSSAVSPSHRRVVLPLKPHLSHLTLRLYGLPTHLRVTCLDPHTLAWAPLAFPASVFALVGQNLAAGHPPQRLFLGKLTSGVLHLSSCPMEVWASPLEVHLDTTSECSGIAVEVAGCDEITPAGVALALKCVSHPLHHQGPFPSPPPPSPSPPPSHVLSPGGAGISSMSVWGVAAPPPPFPSTNPTGSALTGLALPPPSLLSTSPYHILSYAAEALLAGSGGAPQGLFPHPPPTPSTTTTTTALQQEWWSFVSPAFKGMHSGTPCVSLGGKGGASVQFDQENPSPRCGKCSKACVVSSFSGAGYAGGYNCDVCNKKGGRGGSRRGGGGDMSRWHCSPCRYDVCFSCTPEASKSEQVFQGRGVAEGVWAWEVSSIPDPATFHGSYSLLVGVGVGWNKKVVGKCESKVVAAWDVGKGKCVGTAVPNSQSSGDGGGGGGATPPPPTTLHFTLHADTGMLTVGWEKGGGGVSEQQHIFVGPCSPSQPFFPMITLAPLSKVKVTPSSGESPAAQPQVPPAQALKVTDFRVRIPATLPLERALYDPLVTCADGLEALEEGGKGVSTTSATAVQPHPPSSAASPGGKCSIVASGGVFWGTGGLAGVGGLTRSLQPFAFTAPPPPSTPKPSFSYPVTPSSPRVRHFETPPPPVRPALAALLPTHYRACVKGVVQPSAAALRCTNPHSPGFVQIPLTNALRGGGLQWRTFTGVVCVDDASPVPRGVLMGGGMGFKDEIAPPLFIRPVHAVVKNGKGEVVWKSPPLYQGGGVTVPFAVDVGGDTSITLGVVPMVGWVWRRAGGELEVEGGGVIEEPGAGGLIPIWATPTILILHATLSQDPLCRGVYCWNGARVMEVGGGVSPPPSTPTLLEEAVHALEHLAARTEREGSRLVGLAQAAQACKALCGGGNGGGGGEEEDTLPFTFARALSTTQHRVAGAWEKSRGSLPSSGVGGGGKGGGVKKGKGGLGESLHATLSAVTAMAPFPASVSHTPPAPASPMQSLQTLHAHFFPPSPTLGGAINNASPYEPSQRFFTALETLLRRHHAPPPPPGEGQLFERALSATLEIATCALKALAWSPPSPYDPSTLTPLPLPTASTLEDMASALSLIQGGFKSPAATTTTAPGAQPFSLSLHQTLMNAIAACTNASLAMAVSREGRLSIFEGFLGGAGGEVAFVLPLPPSTHPHPVGGKARGGSATTSLLSLFARSPQKGARGGVRAPAPPLPSPSTPASPPSTTLSTAPPTSPTPSFTGLLLALQQEAQGYGMGGGAMKVCKGPPFVTLTFPILPSTPSCAFLLEGVPRVCKASGLGAWRVWEGGSPTLPFSILYSGGVEGADAPTRPSCTLLVRV